MKITSGLVEMADFETRYFRPDGSNVNEVAYGNCKMVSVTMNAVSSMRCLVLRLFKLSVSITRNLC